jgi:hypothetical protein
MDEQCPAQAQIEERLLGSEAGSSAGPRPGSPTASLRTTEELINKERF